MDDYFFMLERDEIGMRSNSVKKIGIKNGNRIVIL